QVRQENPAVRFHCSFFPAVLQRMWTSLHKGILIAWVLFPWSSPFAKVRSERYASKPSPQFRRRAFSGGAWETDRALISLPTFRNVRSQSSNSLLSRSPNHIVFTNGYGSTNHAPGSANVVLDYADRRPSFESLC